MAKNVVGLFDTSQDAQATVRDLRDAGFSNQDIDFLANNASGEYGSTTADTSEAGEGAGFGATGGAVLGGLAGLLLGLGVFALPGIGLVAGAGTLLGTLGTTALGAGIGAAAGGLVGALVGAGIPDEDANLYAEGVRRGGTLVSVRTDDDRVDAAIDVMQRHNVVDIDERGTQFRSEGWTRFDENAQPYDRSTAASYTAGTTSGMGYGDADTSFGDDYDRSSKVGTAGGGLAGAATGAAIGSVGGPVGTVIGGIAGAVTGGAVGAAGDAAGVEASDDEADRGMSTTGTTTTGTAYGSTTDASYSTTGTTGTTRTDLNQGGEVTVPIVEEELRVGKRAVQRGGVRVFTRIQEVPVSEQVTVREETVRVDRRPVDRATTDIDPTTAFQEGTYEVRERGEEVITDKQARVVEEVEIRKTAEERTETVQDTVRRTDVEVEELSGTTGATTTQDLGRVADFGVTGTDTTTGSTGYTGPVTGSSYGAVTDTTTGSSYADVSGTTGDADTSFGDDYDRSSKIGTAGGGLAGAATGAAIGSAGGPVGTVIGGIAGAVTGGGIGAAGDAAGADASDEDDATDTTSSSTTNR